MYKYNKEEGSFPLFSFETKYGLVYYIAFQRMDIGNDKLNNLFSMSFWEKDNSKFKKDPEIEETIISIIKDFFNSNPEIILHYVCESSDFKQDFREKLFDKWCKKYQTDDFLNHKINYLFPNQEIEYKFMFIFKVNYYDLNVLTKNIIDQLEEFKSYKID